MCRNRAEISITKKGNIMSNEYINIIDETWPVGHRFAVSLTVKEKGAAGYFMNHIKPNGNNEELYGCDVEAIHFRDDSDVTDRGAKLIAQKSYELQEFCSKLVQYGSSVIESELDTINVTNLLENYCIAPADLASRIDMKDKKLNEIMLQLADILLESAEQMKQDNM